MDLQSVMSSDRHTVQDFDWQFSHTSGPSPKHQYRPRGPSLRVEQFLEIKEKNLFDLRTHQTTVLSSLQHFAPAYLALGRCYHKFPLSARNSENLIIEYRDIASEAFTAPTLRELPALVYVFGEMSQRVREAGLLVDAKNAVAAETRLQRCDGLLAEAELRIRFLQIAVEEIWFLLGREKDVYREEVDEEGKGRGVLEAEWVKVLPEVCFGLGWGGGGVDEHENFEARNAQE